MPASWVADEALWEQAKAAVDRKKYSDDETYYAVVVSVYKKMGGSIKKKSKKESEQRGKKTMKSKHTLTYEKPILTLGVPAQHLMTIGGQNLEPIEKGKALGIGTIKTHGGKKKETEYRKVERK